MGDEPKVELLWKRMPLQEKMKVVAVLVVVAAAPPPPHHNHFTALFPGPPG